MTDHKPLIEEAREHIEHLAQGVPGAQADRIRRGESDDPRTALVVRLAAREKPMSDLTEPLAEVQIKPGQVWRRTHDQAEFEVLEVYSSFVRIVRCRWVGRGLNYVHPWIKVLRRSYELVRDVEGDEQ